MNIREFVSMYKNHPIFFIGTGVSLRYLENSFTWDGLLKKISYELKNNNDYYLDIKSKCQLDGNYNYTKIASLLESEFNSKLETDRNGKFKEVNDIFYKNMAIDINISRLKIFISSLLNSSKLRSDTEKEIAELKRTRKNVGSIITTNYDTFIEECFGFNPLIGNDILLSNPYGSVYKIHGCVNNPEKIIITERDYENFNKKYELIRAQLLSMFIHNPIVFIGYNIGDENIKSILKTIFTYVESNSEDADRIRKNFLLVEHDKGSTNHDIQEHDIDIEGYSTIRINKIKTDDYFEIYNSIARLDLPVSAMDVRKVQSVVRDISAGGEISVNITEDLNSLKNEDKVLVIGSIKTIQYTYQTTSEMMINYFDIIEESNDKLLTLIDKQFIRSTQFFPIYGFATVNPNLEKINSLKLQQKKRLSKWKITALQTDHTSIEDILNDNLIAQTVKRKAIFWGVENGTISLEDLKDYLIGLEEKTTTVYRALLCLYDYKTYGD